MDFMRWQKIKRDYEERTGEPWPGFGETERRRIAAERGEGDESAGDRPAWIPDRRRMRRRPWK